MLTDIRPSEMLLFLMEISNELWCVENLNFFRRLLPTEFQ